MLPQNKDVRRKILNELNDDDLLNFCASNEDARNLCNNDQDFWKLRIFSRFEGVPLEIYMKNKSGKKWSDYYIKDIRKVNESNANKYLETGSKEGRLDYIMIAQALGADIHRDGERSLTLASSHGHLDIVEYLVAQGADIHAYDDYALMRASRFGHLDVVKYLVDHGADVHALDNQALRMANYYGHSDIVKYLKSISKRSFEHDRSGH